jgi:hypothetical protein
MIAMRCFDETFEVANYDKIINNKTRRKEKKRRNIPSYLFRYLGKVKKTKKILKENSQR